MIAARTPLFVALLALSACSVGPDFQRPGDADAVNWSAQRGQTPSQALDAPLEAQWWTLLGDSQLNDLQHRVAATNLDLREADARLQQSRAIRQALGGDAVPNVGADLGYQRKRNSEVGLSDPSGKAGKDNFNQLDGGFDLSWELDFSKLAFNDLVVGAGMVMRLARMASLTLASLASGD